MSLLKVSDLTVDYRVEQASLRAVDKLSFGLGRGKTLGLVGESGCGKTTAMMALMRLLPEAGRIVKGEVLLDGIDLMKLTPAEIRKYRWDRIAMIFQSAMNALNPTRTIKSQIAEAIRVHNEDKKRNIGKEVKALMDKVGISFNRADQYPHQFSGGMKQRVLIAMALACNPDILIADEPTTALDVMIQAQILNLLKNLQRELRLSVIVVTHDLGVVAEVCDHVLVMYGGWMMEYGEADVIYNHPQHPYTQRLLKAFPDIDNPEDILTSIPGQPPSLENLPSGCRFYPRCQKAKDVCKEKEPGLYEVSPGHFVKCIFAEVDHNTELTLHD